MTNILLFPRCLISSGPGAVSPKGREWWTRPFSDRETYTGFFNFLINEVHVRERYPIGNRIPMWKTWNRFHRCRRRRVMTFYRITFTEGGKSYIYFGLNRVEKFIRHTPRKTVQCNNLTVYTVNFYEKKKIRFLFYLSFFIFKFLNFPKCW